MTRRRTILITCTCLFLLLIIVGAIYANYFINYIVSEQNPQHVIEDFNNKNIVNNDEKSDTVIKNAIVKEENTAKSDSTEKLDIQTNSSKHPIDKITTNNNNQLPIISISNNTNSDKKLTNPPTNESSNNTPTINSEIVNIVQQEVGRPIDTTDLFQAGLIILNKLSTDEINFLFGFSNNSYTIEDEIEVRRLLFSKLNDEDINTLRALGQKYGKNLEILDPNIPIK